LPPAICLAARGPGRTFRCRLLADAQRRDGLDGAGLVPAEKQHDPGLRQLVFRRPWTYDKCEEERIKLPPETAIQMLCVRENRKPDIFGRS
jgi:hypothetical protein